MSLIYFDGPDPAIGRQWCAVCAMMAKQEIVARNEAMVKQAAMTGSDAPAVRINMQGRNLAGIELAPAVTVAISTVLPQFGPLPVCWSHVLGVELRDGLMPANPQEAAMFGQGVPLGQGNRR